MHIRSSLRLNWQDDMSRTNMEIWHCYKIGEHTNKIIGMYEFIFYK
jgi:hypothetical protein